MRVGVEIDGVIYTEDLDRIAFGQTTIRLPADPPAPGPVGTVRDGLIDIPPGQLEELATETLLPVPFPVSTPAHIDAATAAMTETCPGQGGQQNTNPRGAAHVR